MAFVVITHLHPEHESHMAELLQRHTQMPVMQVRKRTSMAANHVYVIPPNRNIIMTDTHLDTREFEEPHGRRTPIDHFFRSMAASGHDFSQYKCSTILRRVERRMQLHGSRWPRISGERPCRRNPGWDPARIAIGRALMGTRSTWQIVRTTRRNY